MDAWSLVWLALACRALVDCLAEGSLFRRPRNALYRKLPLVGELWICRFCLTFHVSYWLYLGWRWWRPPAATALEEAFQLVLGWLTVAGSAILVMRISDWFRDTDREDALAAIANNLQELDRENRNAAAPEAVPEAAPEAAPDLRSGTDTPFGDF